MKRVLASFFVSTFPEALASFPSTSLLADFDPDNTILFYPCCHTKWIQFSVFTTRCKWTPPFTVCQHPKTCLENGKHECDLCPILWKKKQNPEPSDYCNHKRKVKIYKTLNLRDDTGFKTLALHATDLGWIPITLWWSQNVWEWHHKGSFPRNESQGSSFYLWMCLP